MALISWFRSRWNANKGVHGPLKPS
jgi:hypothetical protein